MPPAGAVPNCALPVPSSADAAKAPGLVEASLLALGPEEPAVPQLPQHSRPLHRRLEPLEELLPALTFAQCDERQISTLRELLPLSIARAVDAVPVPVPAQFSYWAGLERA